MANEFSTQLATARTALNDEVIKAPDLVQHNLPAINLLIESWWSVYEKWESKDTFNDAFKERRMSVRTFDAGFTKQVSKQFGKGSISIFSSDKDHEEVRMFADSKYTALEPNEALAHNERFSKGVESQKYLAQRGIDGSAFADPENFKSRGTKYAAGLHDLSASLLNPDVSIFNQIHNKDQGAHFSFLPLSEEEDQELLFNLILCAKKVPALYDRVRTLRANMTRVKLACEYDMGIVYSAAPMANWKDNVNKEPKMLGGYGKGARPGIPLPAYKLRYGLGLFTTITGPNGKQTVSVTKEVYEARQAAARRFKGILGLRGEGEGQKNEIVVAPRKHRGPFPVYATRSGELLKCYEIGDNKGVRTMKYNKKTISSAGVMTG